jgi:REP element-mobilizing transposase RayT
MSFYRRNLPHWHPAGRVIFLTWRLAGSLPAARRSSKVTPSPAQAGRTGKSAGATRSEEWTKEFQILDAELDRGVSGPLWLRNPAIAGYVEDAIIRGSELGHYLLHAYVVMPNHVHVLLEPRIPLARITGSIKGVSARDANATLGRVRMPFWQDESFDHWLRNGAEFQHIRHYIEQNPVTAGLVASPQEWPHSSVGSAFRTVR